MKRKLLYVTTAIVGLVALFATYFFAVRHYDKKILEGSEVLTSVKQDGINNLVIPAHFVDGERFYFKLPIAGNDTIMAFGDTGGGISFLSPYAKDREGIAANLKRGIFKGMMPIQYILFEDLVSDSRYPTPNPNSKMIIRNPFFRVTSPILMIPPMDDELKMMLDVQPEMDAFLGQTFFMDHAWTIDYLNEKIMVNTPLHDSILHHTNVQKLGFKKNAMQQKLNGHPSMAIVVEGDSIDVLFDTGATFIPTDEGKKILNTENKSLGGSFIAASICAGWRKEHPEWKYFVGVDFSGDMIEVPIVNINGHEVGPVLFTIRPDEVWSEGMIATMDKVVQGAIGGSALKYFKVTIDYNSELIRFER